MPVLDGAHERGISVLLGTPTYAVPPWLQAAYPEIAAERRTGAAGAVGCASGGRLLAPRLPVPRRAGHPSGGVALRRPPCGDRLSGRQRAGPRCCFHNRGSFQRFVRRLRQQYGDVETLNREWGLDVLVAPADRAGPSCGPPDGNTLPQYDLAWRRYQADLTTEFIAWQAGIVREHSSRRPIRHDLHRLLAARSGGRGTRASRSTSPRGIRTTRCRTHLDATRDSRSRERAVVPPSGVAALLRAGRPDLLAPQQSRFFVTETDAQSIGRSDLQYLPPYPGQLTQAAFAFISRGAAMIEYWHWHTLPYGAETYWGGVLPHSLVPGRVYREVSDLGAPARRRSASRSTASSPTPMSHCSGRTTAGSRSSSPRRLRCATAGPTARPIHASSTRSTAGSSMRVPRPGSLHVRRPGEIGRSRSSHRGSRCSSSLRSMSRRTRTLDAARRLCRPPAGTWSSASAPDTATRSARARRRRRARPAPPTRQACSYEEFSNILEPVAVEAEAPFELRSSRPATLLGGRAHPRRSRRAAPGTVIRASCRFRRHHDQRLSRRRSCDRSSVAYLRLRSHGTIVRWVVPSAVADLLAPERALPVTVSSGTLPDGRRVVVRLQLVARTDTVVTRRPRRRWTRPIDIRRTTGDRYSRSGRMVDPDPARRVRGPGNSPALLRRKRRTMRNARKNSTDAGDPASFAAAHAPLRLHAR